MKKLVISVFTALLLASAAGAQNVLLTNTFGGNSDNVGTSDFLTSLGTIRSGLRVFFNDKDGFNGFNIPFSWQYKISK